MSEVLHHTSADALGRHQLADLLARVKHACLHRVMRDADDFGDLINRLVVVIDLVNDLTMCG